MAPRSLSIAAAVALCALVGCAPSLGDSCSNSADCSVNGDRICDIASPGGYCTVRGCDPETCPGSGVCVEWRGDPPRTAETWCMKRCGSDSDCRRKDGYACVRDGDSRLVDAEGDSLANTLEDRGPELGFCAPVSVGLGP